MNTLSAKRWVGRFWRHLPSARPRSIVLIYHGISDRESGGPESAVRLADFRSQMTWLSEHAQVVPLPQILSRERTADLRVSITFDDGYRSVCEHAAPVLDAHGFRAAAFVNTGAIAGDRFMTWEEVQALARRGWTIGSHGVTHVDLTASPPPEVERQVVGSKQEIELRLQTPCDYFCYTWGRHDPHVRAAVGTAGYRAAFAGIHAPIAATDDVFALPRVDVRADYAIGDFAAAVRGDWDFLGLLQRARR
jgi:peptidoglycan/xylan/chitin deacetylase (PgdA/CDA1 family)